MNARFRLAPCAIAVALLSSGCALMSMGGQQVPQVVVAPHAVRQHMVHVQILLDALAAAGAEYEAVNVGMRADV